MPFWLAVVLLALAVIGIVLCRKYLRRNKTMRLYLCAAGVGLHPVYRSDPSLCGCSAKSAACIVTSKTPAEVEGGRMKKNRILIIRGWLNS